MRVSASVVHIIVVLQLEVVAVVVVVVATASRCAVLSPWRSVLELDFFSTKPLLQLRACERRWGGTDVCCLLCFVVRLCVCVCVFVCVFVV
jgi:hypothetical protein